MVERTWQLEPFAGRDPVRSYCCSSDYPVAVLQSPSRQAWYHDDREDLNFVKVLLHSLCSVIDRRENSSPIPMLSIKFDALL